MTFKDFLAEREPSLREAQAIRDGILAQWINAVLSLYTQVEGWLKESDTNNLMQIRRRSIQITENELETYQIPSLEIGLGRQMATFWPIARYVRGPLGQRSNGEWTGKVDLTNGEEKFELYRLTHENGHESWWVRSTQTYKVVILTRELLEECLMALFS